MEPAPSHREIMAAFQPLYQRLHKELSQKITEDGYPVGIDNEVLRHALRRILAERRVPGASRTLDAIMSYLGHGPKDEFAVKYKELADQIGDRQLSIAALSKDALRIYLDLHEYRERLAKEENVELFSAAFGRQQPIVSGILNNKKDALMTLEEPETADALLNALCDETTLMQNLAKARAEKFATLARLCESIRVLVKDFSPLTHVEVGERIGISSSSMILFMYHEDSPRLSIEFCQDVLQRLERLHDTSDAATAEETAPAEPATMADELSPSTLGEAAQATQAQLINDYTMSKMGKEEFAEAIRLPNKKSIYRLLKGEGSEAAYVHIQKLLDQWHNRSRTPEPAQESASTETNEDEFTAESAEDIAHSSMAIIQSATKMLGTAGKTYVFPHELQVKALNTIKILKRIALQGAKEEDVLEGRPLSPGAFEALTGRQH